MFVNLFPTMFLALIAHTALRVVFGSILLVLGYKHLTTGRAPMAAAIATCSPRLSGAAGVFAVYVALVEIVLGFMFIFGAYTQVAALVAIAFSLKMLMFRRYFALGLMPSPAFFVLAIGVSLSLFITGAGAFALDIPL
jgi:uncharacterized membrane protein YphA (DoxX/SURF4 family)